MTYLSATELTNAQIVKQFPLSLEGAPIRWYYNLESSVQVDWKELCAAFIQQYGLNTPMDVSLRDLQNMKQKFNESFSEYLTRWRGKMSLMKHRLAESDQLTIVIEGCVPMFSIKLRDLGIRFFEELHRFKKRVTWPKTRNFSAVDHQLEEMEPDPAVPVDQAIMFKSTPSSLPPEDFPT